MVELQRLAFAPERAQEGLRAARELWEILRRKQGYTLHHFYRETADAHRLAIYSEWDSLNLLAGARRELARSPLYRRFHSMLQSSSERAFEPFGAVNSTQGINFSAGPYVIMAEFTSEPEDAAETLDLLKESAGYLSHLLSREVGDSEALLVIGHFDDQGNAASAKASLEKHEKLQGKLRGVEILKS